MVQTSARVNPAKLVIACGTESDDNGNIAPIRFQWSRRSRSQEGATVGRVTAMATYKNGSELSHSDSDVFDKTHKPGEAAPYSGIYICENCRDEDACNAGNPLPPQNRRQHDPAKGQIRWKLLV